VAALETFRVVGINSDDAQSTLRKGGKPGPPLKGNKRHAESTAPKVFKSPRKSRAVESEQKFAKLEMGGKGNGEHGEKREALRSSLGTAHKSCYLGNLQGEKFSTCWEGDQGVKAFPHSQV